MSYKNVEIQDQTRQYSTKKNKGEKKKKIHVFTKWKIGHHFECFYGNFMLILATEKLTMHMLVEGNRKTETFQYISYIISVSAEVLSNELHLRI